MSVTEANASPRMTRLREALHGAPSEDGFRRVFDLIAECSEGYPTADLPGWRDLQERRDAIDAAEVALRTWDDSTRLYGIDSDCFVTSTAVLPWAKLVRGVHVYRRSDNLGPARMALIAASPLMAELNQIIVTRSEGDILEPFTQPTEVRRIVVLDITDGYVAPDTWRALATAPQLAALERLRLADMSVTPDALAAWLDGMPGRSLNHLELEAIAGPVLQESVLPRPRILRQLASLAARDCYLDDHAAALLAGATDLAHLHTLDLRGNAGITQAGRAMIQGAPQFRSTTVLF